MGIDAKEFQAFMWRAVKFSINTCTTLAQKYPFASGVLISLLVLYLFLPSVFFFLIYSLPFLGCTAVFIRYYLNTQRPKNQHGVERKEHGISSAESAFDAADAANRDDNSSIEARRLLQRNVNKDNDESNAHAVKEEIDMVSSMISNDELIGRSALVEEKTKIIVEEKEICTLNSAESSSHNVSIGENISEFGEAPNAVLCDGFSEQPVKLQVGGDVELESSSSEADDDEEEEESEKGGENAVQWTEYDQKNVMDLGNSEIERNRRLEILIARRRARKSFKMNSVAGPGPMHPVLVARSNTFHVSKSSDNQIPYSAPSILLPNQNPFDLPYDPHEEKPNLMADSFHEEFMADHLKELPFCRHESFSLGNSFQDNMLDQHEGRGYSRPTMQSDKGNHDRLVDHLLFHGGETLRRNLSVTDLVTEESQSSNQEINKQEQDREVGTGRIKLIGEKMEQSHCKDQSLGDASHIKMEKEAIKHKNIWSSPSSSTEDIFNAKTAENSESQQPTTFKFPEVFQNRAPNSLPCPVPKARVVAEPSYDSSPSATDSTRMEEHLFYKHDPGHTPTYSIASDMQVEVSEIGSPPLTADGTASSNDDESLIYDGDSEKELTSGSEEMWGASPLAPKVQEHEKLLRQIYEVEEEDMTEVGFSRVRNEPEDPISSSMWSLSSSRPEISQEAMKIDPKLSNHVKDEVEEVREQRLSNSSDVVPPENSLEGTRLMKDPMAHTPSEVYFPKPLESSSASGNSAEEINTNCNANDKVVYDDREDLKSNENRYVGAENSMMQEVLGNQSEPAEGNSSKSKSDVKSESLFNPDKSVESIDDDTCNVNDSRFLINDLLEDLKSNEERDSGAERVIGDLSQPAVESNSEYSNHIESKSLNSPEKSREEANIAHNVNDPLAHNKDRVEDFEDIDRDSERLTEDSDIQSILLPVEAEDNPTSTQGSRAIEVGVCGVDQSFNDPTISATPPELVVEQVSTNSSLSSSPKSVLAYRIPADIGSTSDFSQLVSTDMEENLPLTATQDTSLVNDSIDHPSIDSKSDKSEEPSDTQGKSTEEAIDIENLNGSVLDDEQIKDNLKSKKNIDDEAETLISNEASVELSRPLEEPQSDEHLEGTSARLVDNEASIDVPKPDEENFSSKVPGVIVEKEDSEADIIHDVNESVMSESISNEEFKHVQDSEGESQILDRQGDIMEATIEVEVTNSESIRDIESESKTMSEDGVNVIIPSQLEGEIISSNDTEKTEDPGKSIVQENAMDISKPSSGNDIARAVEDNKGKSEDKTETNG